VSVRDNKYRRGGVRHAPAPSSFCFFRAFGVIEHGDPMPLCSGRLVRCHLIPKVVLERAGGRVWDRRAWVWACGGETGVAGHHGMLDSSRTLRLPRAAIPEGTEELAYELGLMWWLDRTYGSRG